MSRGRISILFAIGVAVAAASGMLAGRWTSAKPASPVAEPNATFDPLELEQTYVGEVESSAEARFVVHVRNTGRDSIRVVRFATNCCNSVASPADFTIAAGATVAVTVSHDLTPQDSYQYGRLTWPFELQLTAHMRDPARKRQWSVRGTARAALSVSAPLLHFGESNRFGQAPVSRVLTVLTANPADEVDVRADNPAVRVVAVERSAGRAVVRVEPDTKSIRGPFNANLRVVAIAADRHVSGATEVEVRGVVRDPEGSADR